MSAQGIRERWRRRLALRLFRPPRDRDVVWHPAPRESGTPGRGRQIVGGLWHMAGQIVDAPDGSPWDIVPPSTPFEMQLHGQGWLDDLVALGTTEAVTKAQGWTLDWMRRFRGGRGPGWDASLTGRRLLRQIDHASVLLPGLEPRARAVYLDALYAQATHLRRDWSEAPAGLARMEALTGLLFAGLSLRGMSSLVGEAAVALVETVERDVGADGGIGARNPEALLEMAMLLNWTVDGFRARSDVPVALRAAQGRIAPTLRALTHSDGGLARFHGGGRGRPGRLERVLAATGIDGRRDDAQAMGFAAIARGRTTLIVDAAPPPTGAQSGSAHASTLAFEMTDGDAPLVVNCGPGGAHGPDWHRAGRATASHSSLGLDGHSSARVGALIPLGRRRIAPLVQIPGRVDCQRADTARAAILLARHDGYGPSHGLTHLRRLALSQDGLTLEGEDSLRAMGGADRTRLDLARAEATGVAFDIRFHLHPDTAASLDEAARAVAITLPTGAVWTFRTGSDAALALAPSVYLEPDRPKPRPALQVVLSDRVVSYAATIEWTLTRLREAEPPHDAES
ncbi:heparinase II/III family protein [uncultured Jannaschia sp.]|uniref:heparinase II/III family protein n=1 Tax=uncultured Jannaschia sp. TaxID=293347 RepID=UPI0026226E02|nr:heparinase II/III family protein [uncultured Jannaschia sp.]